MVSHPHRLPSRQSTRYLDRTFDVLPTGARLASVLDIAGTCRILGRFSGGTLIRQGSGCVVNLKESFLSQRF